MGDGQWAALRIRLLQRFTMAREVLDREGYGGSAVVIPIEEVLIWMDEIEGSSDV